jgi:hypothetical protein
MLHNSVIAGHTVTVVPEEEPKDPSFIRSRGQRGREEASERGIVTGNGPSGGITRGGRNVVLYGLPGKMTPEAASYYLGSFKLASQVAGSQEENITGDIVKMEQCVLILVS